MPSLNSHYCYSTLDIQHAFDISKFLEHSNDEMFEETPKMPFPLLLVLQALD